jgi:hypothetical protein
MEGLKKDTTINFPKIGESLIISAKVWGVSGNHEEVQFIDLMEVIWRLRLKRCSILQKYFTKRVETIA